MTSQYIQFIHDTVCSHLLGDTGKCTHFPYLMFSILKINSDHIIEKINFMSIFYFIWNLISIFLRHWKSYKIPVSWLFD